MRNKKKMMEKICALVFTIILINMTFAFAISLQIPTVAAASGTCIQNRAGTNFCYESASEPNDCYLWRDGKTVDQVDECKLGTCVPAGNGACIENKAKASCEYNNGGRWYDSTKDNVADCNTGCCVAPNKAECLTSEEKAVCVKKGYTWDTKSEQECKNVCGAVEYGCCNDAGIFTNKHRSECAGTFYGNAIYCSQVIGSGIQSCKDVKCGDGSSDLDKYDVYCYDSAGTREMIAPSVTHTITGATGTGDCSSEEICKDDDEAMGKNAYCKSTKCVDLCESCSKNDFKNGESICANVAGGFFDPGSRSSYLKNYIIRCQNGEIKADDSYDPQATRDKICQDTTDASGLSTTKVIVNNWAQCLECGKSGGDFLDVLGYIPAFGPLALGILDRVGISHICTTGEVYGDSCKDKGKVDGVQMCDGGTGSYDHDMWAPIGSCNPVYPPGGTSSSCGSCGEGGDALTNVCTEEECNHLGDCQFTPDGNALAGMGTAGVTALGTAVAGYIVCKLLPVSWAATNTFLCEKGTGRLMENMIVKNPNLIYWGVYSLAFGITATSAAIPQQSNLELENGKIKLVDAVRTNKALERLYSIPVALVAEWLPVVGLPKGGTVPSNVIVAIGRAVYQKEVEKLGADYLAKKAIADSAAKGNAKVVAKKAVKVASEALKKIGLKNEDILSLAKDNVKTVAKDTANKLSSQDAMGKAKIPYLTAAIAWVSVFISVYTAGRAMNTGSCSVESAMNPGEKATYFGNNANEVCEACGWGEGQPWCTKERCGILGTDCNWTQKPDSATGDGDCVTIVLSDVNAPVINPLKIKYYDLNKNKITNVDDDTGTTKIERAIELPFNMAYIKIGATTNEKAMCRYSTEENKKYDEMNAFAKDTLHPISHETDYIMVDRNILPAQFTYYLKCQDIAGNSPPDADNKNYVRFKIAGGPDSVPPTIQYIDPKIFMPNGTSDVNLKILAFDSNGVKNCTYDIGEGDILMTPPSNIGTSKCSTSTESRCDMFNSASSIHLNCTNFSVGDIPDLSSMPLNQQQAFLQQQNEFRGTKICPMIIKCSDSRGNTAQFNNTIIVTSMFNITIEDIEDKYDRTPVFVINTSRPTVCNYTLANRVYNFNDPVYGTKIHTIEHNETLLPRETPYRISVECRDIAGTKRTATKDFTVLLDSNAPEIIRAYKDGSALHLVTNEKAICVYSSKDCNFDFESGIGMPEGRIVADKDHEALWRTDITYYVKCKDEWENTPGTCTTIIKPYEISSE